MSALESFAGRWFVVKIGGELALDVKKLSRTVGRAVQAFLSAGIKVAVVHGGGPQATELSKKLGLVTKQVAGQRVTDEATLEVMKQVLGGVGVNVAQAMRLARVQALSTSGVSAGLVEATRRPLVRVGNENVDYGLVGDVTNVNVPLLESLAKAGVVKTYEAFYSLLLRQKSDPEFQPGVFKLAKKMSAASALAALQDPALYRIEPELAWLNPAMLMRIVVLPEPLGPSRARNSPAAMSMVTLSTARNDP